VKEHRGFTDREDTGSLSSDQIEYLKRLRNENQRKFKGELWYGLANGRIHVEIFFFNDMYRLHDTFEDKKAKLKTPFFTPLMCLTQLIEPIVDFDTSLFEKSSYSTSYSNYVISKRDKLKAKIMGKSFFAPIKGNFLEPWYQTIFPHLGFLDKPREMFFDYLKRENGSFQRLHQLYVNRLFRDFLHLIPTIGKSTQDIFERGVSDYYKDFSCQGSPDDITDSITEFWLDQFHQDDSFLEFMQHRFATHQIVLALDSLEWQEPTDLIEFADGSISSLSNLSRVMNPWKLFDIVPTFDNPMVKEILQLVGLHHKNVKPKDLSWRDYNARLIVYNKFLAPKLKLTKVSVHHFSRDNNLKRRVDDILRVLPDFDVYDIAEIKEHIGEVLVNLPLEIPVIVPTDISDCEVDTNVDDLVSKVVECMKKSIEPNDPPKYVKDGFESEAWDKMTFLTEENILVGSRVMKLTDNKNYKNLKPRHPKLPRKKQYKPICGADMGEDCKLLGNMTSEKFVELFINNVRERSNMRVENSSKRLARQDARFYFPSQSIKDNAELIRIAKMGSNDLKRIEDGLPKRILKVLKSEEDFKAYYKMKYFSMSVVTARLRRRMYKIAVEILNEKNPEHFWKYNPVTMTFTSDHSLFSTTNSEFCERIVVEFENIIKDYKLELESEQETKSASFNRSKMINSIKYHNVTVKKIFESRRSKINKTQTQERLKILLMDPEEYVKVILTAYKLNYLNKKHFQVQKYYRRNLIHIIFEHGDNLCARSPVEESAEFDYGF